jgi:peptide/nickel transport system substrate-binding protein
VRDLPDLTLLAPAQITIYNKKIVDHTVMADGISGNLADVYIQI